MLCSHGFARMEAGCTIPWLMSDRRRDGAKLSFAELDKLRRERKHGSGGQERTPHPNSARAQQSYRAALERAFDSGTLAEFAATMQRARNPLATPARNAPASARTADMAEAAEAAAPAETAGPEPAEALRMDAAPGAPGDSPAADAGATAEAVTTPAAPARGSQRAEQRRMAKELAKKITETTDPREIAKAAERYLARFDTLPRDLELLEKLLGHPKTALVLCALETLEAAIAKQKPRRSRSLSVQLSILEETHEDSDVRELAARLRALL